MSDKVGETLSEGKIKDPVVDPGSRCVFSAFEVVNQFIPDEEMLINGQ